MILIYFHNPLSGLIFFLGILIGIIILIIWLLLTFRIGDSDKSNEEKVNPITFALNNEKDKKN